MNFYSYLCACLHFLKTICNGILFIEQIHKFGYTMSAFPLYAFEKSLPYKQVIFHHRIDTCICDQNLKTISSDEPVLIDKK